MQVLRHGSFRQRKALEPKVHPPGPLVEVRVEGKSASAYGPSLTGYNEGQPRKNSSKRLGIRSVAGWSGQSTARLGHPL